jgi:hypothetical protein
MRIMYSSIICIRGISISAKKCVYTSPLHAVAIRAEENKTKGELMRFAD